VFWTIQSRNQYLNQSKKSLEKRAWSPSRPIDSSEDRKTTRDKETSPVRHHWTCLHSSPIYIDDKRSKATKAELVTLNTEETLCLLGSCTPTALHGSVAVFGTILSTSLTAYPIYAPRSSPLPIIKPSNRTISVLPTGTFHPAFVTFHFPRP